MKKLRDPNWLLIILFVAIIGVPPIVQTIREGFEDEGVIALQLFESWPASSELRAYEDKMESAFWGERITRPWLQFAQFSALQEGGEKAVVGLDGWYFFKPGLNYMTARVEHRSRNETNDAVAAIVDFRNQLAARGVHLLLMPVPNKESIYPDQLTRRAKNLRRVVAPRTREILKELEASGIETVDLFKEFSEARNQNPAEPLYLAQDTHWSPAGVKIAANAAARRLNQLGWIQRGPIEYRELPAPVERLGDIVRMLQSPQIERSVPPEKVPTLQVVRASDSKPYADDAAAAELLVLGDSFMRVYQQDSPTSAGFIAHLAKDLKQPLMSIINDGGGSTLVREELSARPIFLSKKKVVIWEFVERDIGLGIKGWRRTPLPAVAKK